MRDSKYDVFTRFQQFIIPVNDTLHLFPEQRIPFQMFLDNQVREHQQEDGGDDQPGDDGGGALVRLGYLLFPVPEVYVISRHTHLDTSRKFANTCYVCCSEVELWTVVVEEWSMTSTFVFCQYVNLACEFLMAVYCTWFDKNLSSFDLCSLNTTKKCSDVISSLSLIKKLTEHLDSCYNSLLNVLVDTDDFNFVRYVKCSTLYSTSCNCSTSCDREYVVKGLAPVDACSPGGAEVAKKIGAIMGVEVEEGARKIAQVMCTGGGHDKTRYDYVGLESCLAISRVSSGPLQCSYGCLGGGDCVEACKFDAIHIVDNVAKVDFDKCVACGACVDACPRNIIRIVPLNAKKYTEVPCASHDKGPVVRQACDNGCIGCKICVKACPKEGAIVVENFLAKINYDICIGCGMCSRACPRQLITV